MQIQFNELRFSHISRSQIDVLPMKFVEILIEPPTLDNLITLKVVGKCEIHQNNESQGNPQDGI